MGKKMKMVSKPDPSVNPEHAIHKDHVALGAHVLKSVGEALANPSMPPSQAPQAPQGVMGSAFMPDIGQAVTPPPKIPPPILPPGGGPSKVPPKRFISNRTQAKPAWKSKRETAGSKISSVDKKSPSANKNQQKQIKEIIKK